MFLQCLPGFLPCRQSRGSQVVIGLLGQDYAGLLHCDFYGAYNRFPNLQRCLIHFIRDVHEERLLTPADSCLELLHDKTQFIMDSAKALHQATVPLVDIPAVHVAMHAALADMLAAAPPPSRALTLVERLQTQPPKSALPHPPRPSRRSRPARRGTPEFSLICPAEHRPISKSAFLRTMELNCYENLFPPRACGIDHEVDYFLAHLTGVQVQNFFRGQVKYGMAAAHLAENDLIAQASFCQRLHIRHCHG